MTPLLVIFDVDGTLLDSQAQIVHSANTAFEAMGLPQPPRAEVTAIIGLSLPEAFARLAPEVGPVVQMQLVAQYRKAFAARRVEQGEEAAPLYDGARDALEALASYDEVFLGIATGKSRRGLDHMLDAHGVRSFFHTLHPADLHPSKPHPAMVLAALEDVGLTSDQAVMIGDTSYDMDMARHAGVAGIGVDWGYHDAALLRAAGAETVLHGYAELLPYLKETRRLP